MNKPHAQSPNQFRPFSDKQVIASFLEKLRINQLVFSEVAEFKLPKSRDTRDFTRPHVITYTNTIGDVPSDMNHRLETLRPYLVLFGLQFHQSSATRQPCLEALQVPLLKPWE